MLTIKGFKSVFFDREVAQAVDAGSRKALSLSGRILAQQARRLISRKGVLRRKGRVVEIRASKPGEPPMLRTGLLKRFLFYGYDKASRSVVIGPAKLARTADAPQVLEYGGSSAILVRSKKRLRVGDWGPISSGRGEPVRGIPGARAVRIPLQTQAQADRATEIRNEISGHTRRFKIAARPYMAPAFAKVRDRIAPTFRSVMRGGA